MKTLIICFSQTGNTRKIAERIQRGIKDAGSTCDLVGLSDVTLSSLANYDLIGVGAPVFYYQEPFNLRDFIGALPELEGQQWFVFCTHANIIGNFFPSLAEKLHKKGATVIGFHHSYADLTVPFYPKPSYTSGHPDAIDLDAARAFGREIVARSALVAAGNRDLIPEPGPVSSEEWIEESKTLTEAVIKQYLPEFSINVETCIQCHACEENCPVEGIDIAADPPRIQTPCIYCWRCVTICPTVSVEADWKPLVAKAPENYARYKRELDRVAADGGFRWLVDPESIVFDDPLYRQHQREAKKRQPNMSGIANSAKR